MERSAVERKSRVGEIGYLSLDGTPKYHGTRETLWESGWTIIQG